MYTSDDPTPGGYEDYIMSALRTEGGHLLIGRRGFILYYAPGARLIGYGGESIQARCIAAGLPVIDSRKVRFEDVVGVVVDGSTAAVAEAAGPPPHQALSFAPLAAVAAAYRAVGAEVFNIDGADATDPSSERGPSDRQSGGNITTASARKISVSTLHDVRFSKLVLSY